MAIIRFYDFSGNKIDEYESEDPIRSLVESSFYAPFKKEIVLNGERISGENLLNLCDRDSTIEVYLIPEGPIFIVAAVVAVLTIASAVFIRPNPSIPLASTDTFVSHVPP